MEIENQNMSYQFQNDLVNVKCSLSDMKYRDYFPAEPFGETILGMSLLDFKLFFFLS